MRHLGTSGNKDGMGFMWTESGRIQVDKQLVKTDDETVAMYEKYKHLDCAVHQRNQTRGTVCLENCHPFKITSIDDGDEWDIWMMHNGTVQDIQVIPEWADSRNFAEHFLRPLFLEQPAMARSKALGRILSGLIPNSKFVVLSATGDPNDPGFFNIINSGKGKILKPGIWISRTETIVSRKASSPPVNQSPIGFHPKQLPLAPTVPLLGPPQSVQGNTSDSFAGKKTPVQTGSWVMQSNGLKLFRIEDPSETSDVPPDDYDEREDPYIADDDDPLEMDIAVLSEMTESEVETIVAESPGLAAKILKKLASL